MREVRSRPGKKQVPYVVLDQNGVLVVYKPPHWTMTTTMEMPRETSIQAWLGDSLGHCYPFLQQDPLQAGLVQRLDVETSGPVVVATQSETFRRMWQLRAAGHFYREYVALLHGRLPMRHSCGTLEYSLNTRRRSSKVSERHGQPARTRYQAVAAYQRPCHSGRPPGPGEPAQAAQDFTLLRVRILTGRLHQIRVHLRELARRLGLPVCGLVGDYKYLPREELLRDREFCPRVFLHARVLRFPMPGEQREQCRVSCELPVDLERVLHELTPNDQLTAEFTKLGDFLRQEHSDPLIHPVRTVHVFDGGGPGTRSRSRSPSHWRASSPVPEPAALETEGEPGELLDEPGRAGSGSGSLLETRLLNSPSPCHWRPASPSPSHSPSHSPSPSPSPSPTPGPHPEPMPSAKQSHSKNPDLQSPASTTGRRGSRTFGPVSAAPDEPRLSSGRAVPLQESADGSARASSGAVVAAAERPEQPERRTRKGKGGRPGKRSSGARRRPPRKGPEKEDAQAEAEQGGGEGRRAAAKDKKKRRGAAKSRRSKGRDDRGRDGGTPCPPTSKRRSKAAQCCLSILDQIADEELTALKLQLASTEPLQLHSGPAEAEGNSRDPVFDTGLGLLSANGKRLEGPQEQTAALLLPSRTMGQRAEVSPNVSLREDGPAGNEATSPVLPGDEASEYSATALASEDGATVLASEDGADLLEPTTAAEAVLEGRQMPEITTTSVEAEAAPGLFSGLLSGLGDQLSPPRPPQPRRQSESLPQPQQQVQQQQQQLPPQQKADLNVDDPDVDPCLSATAESLVAVAASAAAVCEAAALTCPGGWGQVHGALDTSAAGTGGPAVVAPEGQGQSLGQGQGQGQGQGERCRRSRKRAALATLDTVAKRHRDPFRLFGL